MKYRCSAAASGFSTLHGDKYRFWLFQHFGVDITGKHFPASGHGAQVSASVIAMLYGSSPVEAAALIRDTRQNGDVRDPRAEENDGLTEKCRQIRGQRIDKRLPLPLCWLDSSKFK